MKKFIKVLLILTAVFLVLGLGFSIGGAAMGATLEGVRIIDEIRYRYREIVDDVWDETLDEIRDEDLEDLADIGSRSAGSSGTGIYEYDPVEKVNADLKYDTLLVEKHEEDIVRVEVKNDPDGSIRVTGDEKELKIQGGSRKAEDRTVILYLPENIKLDKFSAEVDAGKVEVLDAFEADEVDIQVGAGTISNQETLKGREINVEVGTGNVELYGISADRIKGECGAGNLYLNMAGKETDYSYDLECDLGKITIGEKEYFSLNRKQTINTPGAGGKMELDCALGAISVGFEEA
ncbi:MAG TPA: DUF4097 family beta strand repeat protein [Candidatus Blautia faecavium]|uniref:DUF4097 family beta strand repeat protein n=1 Tax=Candidatus Blautia faecavium TaxID=2838487 RepID=A0A9D2LRW5_9FIRM|nr:DUF4097 family beta strand repeat protein [Candidatus Blautia faecavium]